jgi:hypothetical protein
VYVCDDDSQSLFQIQETFFVGICVVGITIELVICSYVVVCIGEIVRMLSLIAVSAFLCDSL